MKKKGFIFAETIIVLSVLSIGLILLYTTFSNVLRKEKVQTRYNQATDIYNLLTIKRYLKAIDGNADAFVLANNPLARITPRGTGAIRNINSGENSLYFRLECLCSDQINVATIRKYGGSYGPYCKDILNPIYSNYCSHLNNHLGVSDIYIIPNNNNAPNYKMKTAIDQIISDSNLRLKDCGGDNPCTVGIGINTFNVSKYENPAVQGFPRHVNFTLEEYLKTLSPIVSTVSGETWENDYIIIGEFNRGDELYYASLRY